MKNFLFILLLFVLISCEKEVEIKIISRKQVIVLNSVLASNSSFKANISSSNDIMDDGELKFLDSAKVTVYNENGSAIDLLPLGNGYYKNDSIVLPGVNYKIEAICPGYDKVTAFQKLPVGVNIDSINSYLKDSFPEHGLNEIQLDFGFLDPANEKNYYLCSVFNAQTNNPLTYFYENCFAEIIYDGENYQNIYPGSQTSAIVKGWAKEMIFNDELFDGKKLSVSLIVIDKYETPIDSVEVKLYTITKDYFMYIKSQANSSNYFEYFNERVQIYSNIKHGLGIFAGYTCTSKSIRLLKGRR